MVGKEPFLSNTQKPLPRVSEGVFVFGGLKGFNGIRGFKALYALYALYADYADWEFRVFPFCPFCPFCSFQNRRPRPSGTPSNSEGDNFEF